MFASKDSTITDEDIDTILQRAEVKTAEIKAKMDEMGEGNLRNLTFDVMGSVSQSFSFIHYICLLFRYTTSKARITKANRLRAWGSSGLSPPREKERLIIR